MALPLHRLSDAPVRLVSAPALAATLGGSASAVRRILKRHGVPRRTWRGRKEKGGPAVYVSDVNACAAGFEPATDAQCRSDLRRAGHLP